MEPQHPDQFVEYLENSRSPTVHHPAHHQPKAISTYFLPSLPLGVYQWNTLQPSGPSSGPDEWSEPCQAPSYYPLSPFIPSRSAATVPAPSVPTLSANEAFTSAAPFVPLSTSVSTHLRTVHFGSNDSNQAQKDGPSQRPLNILQEPSHGAVNRSRYGPALNWDIHYAEIKRLYIDEDNSLEETRKKMMEKGFNASVKLYKDKVKEWRLSKYLSCENAHWMLMKAEKRKYQENKETQFLIGDREWTMDRIQKTIKRSKNNHQQATADDAPTPSTPYAITYNTPRPLNNMPSPCNPVSPKATIRETFRWTPVPSPQAQSSQISPLQQLRLSWNGHTRGDFETMHREAHDLDRLGHFELAEDKFRAALDGLQNVLTPTHEQTSTLAYHLASFYANHNRMNSAYEVLDWMCSKYIERWGIDHKKTVTHLLRVVDMLHSWSRSEDAITIIYQAFEAYEGLIGAGSQSDGGKSPVNPLQASSSRGIFSRRALDATTALTPAEEPALANYQLGLAGARAKMKDDAAEPLLLGLIAQCEKHPKKLAAQGLEARIALLNLYQRLGDQRKTGEALDQAELAFWIVSDAEYEKTAPILDASVELAALHVEVGRLETAEAIFLRVEAQAVHIFGEDDEKTIRVLIAIGMVYQEKQLWAAAQPHFEQALAASITSTGLDRDRTRRLEEALENERYELEAPTCENVESVLRRRW